MWSVIAKTTGMNPKTQILILYTATNAHQMGDMAQMIPLLLLAHWKNMVFLAVWLA